MSSTEGKNENAISTRYILITQCLQNDFFLNEQSKLILSEAGIDKILIGGKAGASAPKIKVDRRTHHKKLVNPENGPLGAFLKALTESWHRENNQNKTLHIINIRDWHAPGDSYDLERKKYGPHCEQGSWGADYIYGLEKYLNPGRTVSKNIYAEGSFYSKGSARYYHVHSDSVFDFKPRIESREPGFNKYRASFLESILDVLIQGTETEIATMENHLKEGSVSDINYETLDTLAQEVDDTPAPENTKIYVGVIGVYTDIKIKTLLTDLNSRYHINNLAVSDTLTGSKSLERHLGALDFEQKVLGVEVIHGLNNLIDFLGGDIDVQNETEIVTANPFHDYVSFFQDKQNVLAYEIKKLQEYKDLTKGKSEEVYRITKLANIALVIGGILFLFLSILGVILRAIYPDQITWELPLLAGGLSIIQLVTVFFKGPMADLLDNLTNIATFRMVLENHSFKKALARYHLTTPQTLRDSVDLERSSNQVKALKEQLEVFKIIESNDYEALSKLGFGSEEALAQSEQLENKKTDEQSKTEPKGKEKKDEDKN